MIVKNNYNECITNLACSIEKYFELTPKHNTLSYIDKLLEQQKPENVIVILLDGLGSKILNRTLSDDSFLKKHLYKEITTVFPATTTAATTSMQTGLNPAEHGWLGWNTYIEPIDKTITLFMNTEKGKDEIDEDFLAVKHKLASETITDQINKIGKYRSVELFPFGENPYDDLDDMLNKIKEETTKKSRKYIYAYDTEPDHTMHDLGPDAKEVRELIKLRNNSIEKLCKSLSDSIVFIIADHGHKVVEPIYLTEYKNLLNMLERTTSIEQRAVSFKVKPEEQENFIVEFNKNFANDFKLYSKEEVLESELFGDGKKNELFEPALGDFIAIAEDSNKCIITAGDTELYSQHAGYSAEEIYIPLIVVDKTGDKPKVLKK